MTYIPVWPHVNYDAQGTNRTVESLSPSIISSPSLYYSYKINAYQEHSCFRALPINFDGETDIVYIATQGKISGINGSKIKAIKTLLSNINKKEELWSYDNDTNIQPVSPILSLTPDGEYILFTDFYDGVRVLNSNDGTLVSEFNIDGTDKTWTPTTGGLETNSSPVFFGPDGFPYVCAIIGATDLTRSVILYKMSTAYTTNPYPYLAKKLLLTGQGKGGAYIYGINSSSMAFNPNVISTPSPHYEMFLLIGTNVARYLSHYLMKIDLSLTGDTLTLQASADLGVPLRNICADNTYPNGVIFKPQDTVTGNRIYFTTSNGLYAYSYSLTTLAPEGQYEQNIATYGYCYSAPCISTDGTIYYRTDKALFAIQDNNASLSLKWKYNMVAPTLKHQASPIIDANGNIIVCNDTISQSNVYILQDATSHASVIEFFQIPVNGSGARGIRTTPSIGRTTTLYINSYASQVPPSTSYDNYLFAYGTPAVPTTTTTTPTTPTTTTPTTTTGTTTGTTTTTTTPTTTTTTTTPAPLSVVRTIFYELVNGTYTAIEVSNASDSTETNSTMFAQAFSFGSIAPGETSKTIIIALNVPNTKAITNIQIALVDSGGVPFSSDLFGITSSIEIRDDITPDTYFQGVNTDKSSTSPYNVTLNNRDKYSSEYVYLNMKLPRDSSFGTGLIKLKWFFDYAD